MSHHQSRPLITKHHTLWLLFWKHHLLRPPVQSLYSRWPPSQSLPRCPVQPVSSFQSQNLEMTPVQGRLQPLTRVQGRLQPVSARSAVPSSSGSSSLVTARSVILSVSLVTAKRAISPLMEIKSLTSTPVLWWSSAPPWKPPAPVLWWSSAPPWRPPAPVLWWSSAPPWLPLSAPPWLPLSPRKSHYSVRTRLWGGGSTVSVTSPELHFPAARLVHTCTLSPISTPVTDQLIPPRYVDCHQSHQNCLVSLQFLQSSNLAFVHFLVYLPAN